MGTHGRTMAARAAGALLLIAAGGCGMGENAALAQVAECRVAQPLVPLPDAVAESSGAAMSRQRPTVVWTHGDSGGDPDLFAVELTGELVGQVRLEGAENVDWEDISSGECAGGDCLYVADIGDNGGERPNVVVYRLREPAAEARVALGVEALPARYPEGPRDAEAIFVLPGERLYIVTKGENSPVALYRYPTPLRPGTPATLELVRRLSDGPVPQADRVTAASASPDGRRVALRTLTSVLIYDTGALLGDGEATPVNVNISSLGEAQGEGIAYGPNGALVVTSEAGDARDAGGTATLGIVWCP